MCLGRLPEQQYSSFDTLSGRFGQMAIVYSVPDVRNVGGYFIEGQKALGVRLLARSVRGEDLRQQRICSLIVSPVLDDGSCFLR